MDRYYVLRDGDVVEEQDFKKWLEWHQSSYEKTRCIAHTRVKFGEVNTVFLGMNMRESENDSPWLFDTRVKAGWLDGKWERCSTLEKATALHEAWVARVREMESDHETPPPDAMWQSRDEGGANDECLSIIRSGRGESGWPAQFLATGPSQWRNVAYP